MEISVNVNAMDITLDTDKLSPEAFRYFMEYGVRQSLADAGAAKKEPTEKREAAEARLKRILAGDIPAGGGGGNVDPHASASVALLKSARVRKLASVKYAPEDVPSAREANLILGFVERHFDPAVRDRIAAAADRIVTAKRLDI